MLRMSRRGGGSVTSCSSLQPAEPPLACANGGVHLVVEDSPVIDALKSLEAKGVRLVLCSTCLNFYHLANQVQVGIVGGMSDIIEAQRRAGKVITL